MACFERRKGGWRGGGELEDSEEEKDIIFDLRGVTFPEATWDPTWAPAVWCAGWESALMHVSLEFWIMEAHGGGWAWGQMAGLRPQEAEFEDVPRLMSLDQSRMNVSPRRLAQSR